jgi:(p)ppGpp synthase/HD superfamily hydrolase
LFALLFQINEDVQRHNELLEVVKATPSDKLGAIVAKRRKDFTVEFFNHLYYVAESYHDDTEKQNGESYIYLAIVLAEFLTHV